MRHQWTIASFAALAMSFAFAACAPGEGDGQTSEPSYPTIGSIESLDPAFDALVPADAVLEILAEGHEWTEGPVWVSSLGMLLYSDIPRNAVYRWAPGDSAAIWLQPAGFTGEALRGTEPGSNGLALDGDGRLVLCQHGDRRIARLSSPWESPAPIFETIAGTYDGKRFNSPNDLAITSQGDIYFTDPPYGLVNQGVDDPEKELDFQGVYRVTPDGTVTLLTAELSRPNGIAFSPDERRLYVGNSDPERPIIMAYDLAEDGTLAEGSVLFDATSIGGGGFDGMKVDVQGNLFATGPGGVLVIAPDGRHLGTLRTTQATANVAFGDDGSTLYITADMYLLRVRLSTVGMGVAG